VFISVVGFGMTGFNYDHLKDEAREDSWYQTIHINNDNIWYGIDSGENIHLFQIGNVE